MPKGPTAAAVTTHDDNGDDDDGGHEPGNLADLIYRQDLREAELGPLGRMCFIGSDVSNFSYLVRQVSSPSSSPSSPQTSSFHFGSRQLHRRHTAHELQRVPAEALERCAPALEQRLLRAYFAHVNPGWAVVDEVHFMAQYRGQDALRNPLLLPLLNAVLLVGAHVLVARDGDGDDGSLAPLQATLFRRAKTLVDCRFEQDRTMYVQVALLLTWYSDGHEEIVANAWHWIGFAIRIAVGHGMHRDATHSKMPPVHRRLWTRLWWILYQFDTAVSAAYGRPQTLHVAPSTATPSRRGIHDFLLTVGRNLSESDVPELEPAHFQGVPNAQVDFAVHHAKLCVLFAEVMKTRWALRSPVQERIAASRKADAALADFLVQLPPSLRLSVARLTPWTATLHLTYHNFVLLLHRPPPLAADAVALACADPALCAGATASMAAILEALCHRGDPATLWLYGVHAAFTALIHVSSELAAPSPMRAARARSLFDTLMEALKCLARYWRFAENILRLFKTRISLLEQESTAAAATPKAADAEGFSLRPAPLAPPVEAAASSWESMRLENEGLSGSVVGGECVQSHGDELPVDEFMMEGFPDSFALELFLAGMDGSTQDVPS